MVIEPELHLRLRDAAASEPLAPPDIAAFLRAPTPPADPRDGVELGALPGTRPVDPDGPLVIFLQPSEFGCPAPGYDLSVPDLESWSVRPTKFGWIATVPPPTRGPGPRRAAQDLAGCLALTLGKNGVNIAHFTLGWSGVGQDAIAILYLDQAIDPKVVDTLQSTGMFQQVKPLEFDVA